jgi:hypothetical protein
MQEDCIPEEGRRRWLRVKDSSILLFPYLAHYEAWYELPGSIQDRNFEGTRAPLLDGVDDAIFNSIGSSHEMSGLVPDVLTE